MFNISIKNAIRVIAGLALILLNPEAANATALTLANSRLPEESPVLPFSKQDPEEAIPAYLQFVTTTPPDSVDESRDDEVEAMQHAPNVYYFEMMKRSTTIKDKLNYAKEAVDYFENECREHPTDQDLKKQYNIASRRYAKLLIESIEDSSPFLESREKCHESQKYLKNLGKKPKATAVKLFEKRAKFFTDIAKAYLKKTITETNPETLHKLRKEAIKDLTAAVEDYNEILKHNPNDGEAIFK